MQPEFSIVERFSETVLFVQEKGDYKISANVAFNKLNQQLERVQVQAFYGMGLDNPRLTEENARRFDACAKVSLLDQTKLSTCMQTKTIQGGRYALFTYKGPYEKLEDICQEIFDKRLPAAKYTPSPLPLFCEYPKDFLSKPSKEKITTIYVPIKA